MLCTSNEVPLVREGWLYELKLDGFRVLADKRGDDAALFFRRQGSANAVFPEVARALRSLAPARVALDGEVIALDDNGRPSFQRLQGRMHGGSSPRSSAAPWAEVPVMYIVFDILALGRFDLRQLPLVERKSILSELVKGKGVLRVLDHLAKDGRPLAAFCEAQHLEGMVAKRADSPYVPGPRRGGDWVKDQDGPR